MIYLMIALFLMVGIGTVIMIDADKKFDMAADEVKGMAETVKGLYK